MSLLSIFLYIYSINAICTKLPPMLDLLFFNKCIGNSDYTEVNGEILNNTRSSPGLDFSYRIGYTEYYCSYSGFAKSEPNINLKLYILKSKPSKCFTCINIPNDSVSGSTDCIIIFLILDAFVICLRLFGYFWKKIENSKSECEYLSSLKCFRSRKYDLISTAENYKEDESL
jgi:hypothetical protein